MTFFLNDIILIKNVRTSSPNHICPARKNGILIISDSVKYIEEFAFYNCNCLEEIVVNENNTKYCSIEGVLYSKDRREIYKCPISKKGEFIIPDGVKDIGPYAFCGCKTLNSIVIPASVESISIFAYAEDIKINYKGTRKQWELIDNYGFPYISSYDIL